MLVKFFDAGYLLCSSSAVLDFGQITVFHWPYLRGLQPNNTED